MTSKSLSSENKTAEKNVKQKARQGAAFSALVAQNLKNNIWLILLGFVIMLFNYPVNMALRLSQITSRFERFGFIVRTESVSTTLSETGGIGGADGPASVFMAEKVGEYGKALSDAANRVLCGSDTLIFVIAAVAAVLCAAGMFRNVYSKQQTDLYQSLPVARGKRFFAGWFTGALVMAVCFALGLLAALICAAFYKTPDLMISEMLIVNAGTFLMFLLVYTAAVSVMLLAGNNPVGTGLIFFTWAAGPALSLIISALKTDYLTTVVNAYEGLAFLKYFSPVTYLAEYASYAASVPRLPAMTGTALIRYEQNLLPHTQRLVLLAAIVTAALFFAGMCFYRRRPAEGAGSSIVFSPARIFLRVFVTVSGALCFSLIGSAIESFAWSIFFALISGLILHAIMEIILHLDVKALFAHKTELLLCLAGSVLVLCVFRFDLTGYNHHVPELSEVSSAGVSVSRYRDSEKGAIADARERYGTAGSETFSPDGDRAYTAYFASGMDRMKITDETVLALIKELAEAGSAAIDRADAYEDTADERLVWVEIRWDLRNGKTDDREYRFEKAIVDEIFPDIFASEEYKEAAYPILSLSEEELGKFGLEIRTEAAEERLSELRERAAGGESAVTGYLYDETFQLLGYKYPKEKIVDLTGLSPELEAELLTALQADLREMALSDYDPDWGSYEHYDLNAVAPQDHLIYVPKEEILAAEYRRQQENQTLEDTGGYEYYDVYPIFQSFTHVRSVLEKYGIGLR